MEWLDELFDEWKKKHSEENDESCLKTFPELPKKYENKGIKPETKKFKKNWTIDGYLNDCSECKILFVLKESNIEELREEGFIIPDSKFWLKDNREKYRKAIPRRLKKLAAKLLKLENPAKWYDYAAVMNINKRGGFSTCNFNNLLEYAKVYGKFIEREIEILNPEKIVFLGKEFWDNRDKLLSLINVEGKELHFHYHPSRKDKNNSFTDEKFLVPVSEECHISLKK